MIGRAVGTIVATRGHLVDALVPAPALGAGARIRTRAGATVAARVVSVERTHATLALLGPADGVTRGDRVEHDRAALESVLGTPLLGRAVDAAGAPLDGGGPARGLRTVATPRAGCAPGERRALREPFWTGVRAIDGPLALARGARIGLFGAPGCGKSTLLETIVNGSAADATVVALVGERGREAQRWLARVDARTTVVCATSDRSPAERVRAAEVAFAQADALRRRGLHVLLVLDSLARFAAAARDIAVAAGEPVGRGGYPSSVFGVLATSLERAGAFATGSITLIATVLGEGADDRDPVSDACRAALDGHVALSPALAHRGWFPAVDLVRSASRTLADAAGPEHVAAARTLRAAVAALDETREARIFGLETAGDPVLTRALAAAGQIEGFLRQDGRPSPAAVTLTELVRLADMLEDGHLR